MILKKGEKYIVCQEVLLPRYQIVIYDKICRANNNSVLYQFYRMPENLISCYTEESVKNCIIPYSEKALKMIKIKEIK